MAERDDVEDLFALAREGRMEPSAALMERVLADAMAAQPKPLAPFQAGRQRRGWFAALADALGGSGGLAGVGGAALAGLFLGFVQPVAVSDVTDAVLGAPAAAVELMPSADVLVAGE